MASFSNGFDGIAGHGVKTPGELAGIGVIGRDIAAYAVLATAVADDDPTFDDARRHGDGVWLAWIDRHDAPDRLAGSRIERHQPAVKRADEYLALPRGDASIDHIAAALYPKCAWYRWIVGPQQRAGLGVVRLDHAPRRRDVQHAVDDERRRLLTAVGVEVGVPGEPKLLHVVGGNPGQRAEALFAIGSAVGHPVMWLGIRRADSRCVDIGRQSGRSSRFERAGNNTGQEGQASSNTQGIGKGRCYRCHRRAHPLDSHVLPLKTLARRDSPTTHGWLRIGRRYRHRRGPDRPSPLRSCGRRTSNRARFART